MRQVGEEGFEGRWVDFFQTEGVDVDVLVGRAGSVVFAEEVEEGGVHQVFGGDGADVALGWVEGFEGGEILVADFEGSEENRVQCDDWLRRFNCWIASRSAI